MLRVRGLIVISSGDAVHDFVRVEAAWRLTAIQSSPAGERLLPE
jgi:hypothetical protein